MIVCTADPCPAPALVRLRLAEEQIHLVAEGGHDTPGFAVMLPLGYKKLANACFAQWPPSPAEIEQAINVVEDELEPGRWPHRDALLMIDAGRVEFLVERWATQSGGAMTFHRDSIERAFEELASASLSRRVGLLGSVKSRDEAAVLLLLRELMHHLGFAHLLALRPGKPDLPG